MLFRCVPIGISLGIFVLLTFFQAALAEDWPHWRGPQRNDTSRESSGWEAGVWPPRKIAWQANLGVGSSSPTVAEGRLYALGWGRGQDTLSCLDAASGKTLWQQPYDCPQYGRHSTGDKGLYAGPCSTPEFDPETKLLYTLSIDGDLNCWESGDGRRVWGFNLYEKYKVPQRPKVGRSGLRDYGYTSSALVWQDWLIVEVGSPQLATLMAFDKRTGREVWKSQDRSPAGHNGGPTPITVEGVPCVANFSHNGLLVARLDGDRAGETVGTFPWITEFSNNIASVTVHEDAQAGASALITSGYNQYAICKLGISLSGLRELWRTEECSKVCSPVVYEGHVYWSWNSLYCLDFRTGKVVWQQAGGYSDPGSCIVTDDGRLILWTRRGKLTLAETAGRSPKAAKILAEADFSGREDAWPHVVLSGGRLYCKDAAGMLKCIPLQAE